MGELPDETRELILDQWRRRGDLAAIEADLERKGADPSAPSPLALEVHDQLHAGLLEATGDFASWVGAPRGCRVLDVGSGLGGAARYLAREVSASVTALELCPELHRAGKELTRRLGLDGAVEHELGDLASFESGRPYDLVWIQHVDMHIPYKGALYRTAAACLSPGGRAVWHDWLAGPAGPPSYPLFWSRDGRISFLSEEGAFRADLAAAGLRPGRIEPIADRTLGWFGRSRKGLEKVIGRLSLGPAGNGARLERLRGLLLEVENAISGIEEGRLIPFYGEATLETARGLEQ